jgi:hypothetical protein
VLTTASDEVNVGATDGGVVGVDVGISVDIVASSLVEEDVVTIGVNAPMGRCAMIVASSWIRCDVTVGVVSASATEEVLNQIRPMVTIAVVKPSTATIVTTPRPE